MEVSLGVFVIVRKPFGNRYTPNRAGAAARVRGEVMHQDMVCTSNNGSAFCSSWDPWILLAGVSGGLWSTLLPEQGQL